MKNIFFDIETLPSQLPGMRDEYIAAVTAPAKYSKAESIAEWLVANRESEGDIAWRKTSFDGGVGHVCAIALAVDDGPARSYQVPADGYGQAPNEESLLKAFFCDLTDIGRSVVIGHNILGFDLPFLWKRAMVLGVKPPGWFPRNPSRYSSEMAFDTMLLWDQDQRAGGSMDRICRLMGIPGKGDISGADVWPMVKAGRISEVAAYCRADVIRTRAMFQRMTFTHSGVRVDAAASAGSP